MTPLLVLLIFGLIATSTTIFQLAALNNAAQNGARAATLQAPLLNPAGNCETGTPIAIEAAVKTAALLVPVDATRNLCATSATHMAQASVASGAATVTVDAWPSLSAPRTITVTVSYVARPLYPMSLTSVTYAVSSTQPAS